MKGIIVSAASFLCAFSVFPSFADEPAFASPPDVMFGSVPGEEKPALSGKISVGSGKKEVSGGTIESAAADESALLSENGATIVVKSAEIRKSGGSSNSGQSNFYGLNAGVLSDGGKISLIKTSVATDAEGANAVFSTGENSFVTLRDVKITTKGNSSRGLDATYGGKIRARGVDITTEGEHCAAFATDRGEGTVVVEKGTAVTRGNGSPVIYSTGDIRVSKLKGSAESSEIACIEGKNSISIDGCELSGGAGLSGETASAVMLYQSMSGDANVGTARFSSSSSSLSNVSDGPFFFVTNTDAEIHLESTKIENPSGILLKVSGNDSSRGWGRAGANGGNLSFSAKKQRLEGDIIVDGISSLSLNLGKMSSFKGKLNEDGQGNVELCLAKNAVFEMTGDCHVNSIRDDDVTFSNIISHGNTLYYDSSDEKNARLNGITIRLRDGGKIAAENRHSERKSTATEKSHSPEKKSAGTVPSQPPLSVVSGILLADNSVEPASYSITGKDGTVTKIRVMMPHPQKNGNPPSPPPSGAGKPMKNPPSPPAEKSRPAPITESALASLSGKNVDAKGIPEKDGTLIIIEITESQR